MSLRLAKLESAMVCHKVHIASKKFEKRNEIISCFVYMLYNYYFDIFENYLCIVLSSEFDIFNIFDCIEPKKLELLKLK